MKKIAIYGAGGFGKEVAFLINDINQMKPQYDFVGYFDDEKTKGDTINLFPILGGIKELNSYDSELALVIAISDPTTKRRIVESVENDCVIVTGSSLLNAYDRLEVAEYSAKALIATKNLGDVVSINEPQIEDIKEAFKLD